MQHKKNEDILDIEKVLRSKRMKNLYNHIVSNFDVVKTEIDKDQNFSFYYSDRPANIFTYAYFNVLSAKFMKGKSIHLLRNNNTECKYCYQNLAITDLPDEIWKDVIGGLYAVSTLGRIKNNERLMTGDIVLRPKIRKQTFGKTEKNHNYLRVSIKINAIITEYRMFKLMCDTFLSKNDDEVFFLKNGDPKDLRIANISTRTKICAATLKIKTTKKIKPNISDADKIFNTQADEIGAKHHLQNQT